jgi:anti-sigma factor RsiW
MNAAGGGQSDGSLDAFHDGRLDAGSRTAFRDRLASDPALALEFEAQQRIDRALGELFAAPRYPGLPGDVLRLPARVSPGGVPVSQTRGVIWGSLIGAALFCLTWFLYTQLMSQNYSLNHGAQPPTIVAPATADPTTPFVPASPVV